MSALPVNHPETDPPDRPPEWFLRLGLHEPGRCAQQLAESLEDDPFYAIGFISLAAAHVGDQLGDLIEGLANYEPALRPALTELVAAMPLPLGDDPIARPSSGERKKLPRWLRELDKVELSGVMRRYEYADRSSSTYLIEAQLPGGHVATGRLSISHGDVDTISEFWTTCMSLTEAARFYRRRYTMSTTQPYRHVDAAIAGKRILEALKGSVTSGQFLDDFNAPIPWPQNMAVLNLMLQPAIAKIDD